MTKAIGIYLIFVAIIWFCVLTCGIELNLKEKLVIGFGYMGLVLLIGVGTYLITGGM